MANRHVEDITYISLPMETISNVAKLHSPLSPCFVANKGKEAFVIGGSEDFEKTLEIIDIYKVGFPVEKNKNELC